MKTKSRTKPTSEDVAYMTEWLKRKHPNFLDNDEEVLTAIGTSCAAVVRYSFKKFGSKAPGFSAIWAYLTDSDYPTAPRSVGGVLLSSIAYQVSEI